MISKGQKRKLHDEDEVVGGVRSATWESQRQSLLDISLEKYHRSHECVEHSLRRSVLIANTLKHMQPELRPLSGSVARVGPIPNVVTPCTVRESGPDVLTNCDPVVVDMEHEWMSSESDFSLSAAVSSILKELDMTMDGEPGPGPRRTTFRPTGNIAGDLGLKQAPSGQRSSEQCAEGRRTSERVVFGGEEVVRASFDGTLDDLLHDINTTVFDREMGVLGVQPISDAASDELLKYLPPLTVPSTSPLPISLSQSAMNLNELEHIMEVLFQS